MEKLTNDLFKKHRLNNSSLAAIVGGDGGCHTTCDSSTCNEATGCGDTRSVTTNDEGTVISDETTSFSD